MSLRHAFVLLLVSSLTAGCTSTIFKSFDLSTGKSKSIDAKQRIILVNNKAGPEKDKVMVCAEPSPDAITALGTAFAGSGGTLTGGGSLSFSSSEAAASIGLRTQTIQLLRDGYYRLCEAYMNGALSREQYNLALVRIDDVMVKLMVVDAVAGTPRPPAVAIAPGVAGASATTSLTGSPSTSEEGEGADGNSGSLNTQAQVGTTQTRLEIEDINMSRSGMNEHDAVVLTTALGLAGESAMPSLCASFMADPGFLTQTGLSGQSLEYKKELLDHCSTRLQRELAPDEKDLESEIARLKDDIEERNLRIEDQKGTIDEQTKAMATTLQDLVTFAKTTTDSAIKHKPTIIVK